MALVVREYQERDVTKSAKEKPKAPGGTERKVKNLLYAEEVYQIIAAAIEVHKTLGPGFLESVYEEALTIESRRRELPHRTQVELPISYKGQELKKTFVADYVAFDKIIVESKCLRRLTRTEEAQLLNYLSASGFELGLLINFGSQGRLEWKRLIKTT